MPVSATFCYGLHPGERDAFADAEYATGSAPHRHKHELVNCNAELEQVTGMHIDAVGAAIYLRNPQINDTDEFL
jgi:hypothetical protein